MPAGNLGLYRYPLTGIEWIVVGNHTGDAASVAESHLHAHSEPDCQRPPRASDPSRSHGRGAWVDAAERSIAGTGLQEHLQP